MEQMRKAKLEQAQEKISDQKFTEHERLAQEQIRELENMIPDMPRFEGFFKSQSKGAHPFEGDEYKFK